MKKDEIVFYATIAIALANTILAIFTINIIVIMAAIISVAVSSFVYKFWYVIDAAIFRRTNLIELFAGYELSGDRSAAIRKIDERISATAVSSITIDGKSAFESKRFENMVSHMSYPFKLVMQVERLNINKVLDNLETRRNMRELELSKIDSTLSKNTPKINHIKRELEQLDHDIKAISTGETPLRLAYYVMTSAVSESLYDAEERAKHQIRELSSQFDALLGSSSKVLTGSDLLRIMEIDSSMMLE